MKKFATHSWATREALARREPFGTYGAFHAVEGYHLQFGNRLPPHWLEQYIEDGADITYTVLSYRTPIAWVLRCGAVVIPDVKYSRTTSGHQELLHALSETAEGPLAIAAQEERQKARERATRLRQAPAASAPCDQAVAIAAEEPAWCVVREGAGALEGPPDIVARIDDVLSRRVPVNSGEAAIYSAEYLERKHGTRDWQEVA
ncbi:hypothetical protein [Streptomyces melanosporofaciens]|uniref:DUF8033 domain-containing protein n=1 Tax=Streptomyces melanosporofaciens TaxID=67327 RepID=A0A1H4KPR9_STRMJ|nr:hypothetical protein [Streptomyces melanosporofaciens]SEB60383.1 hypothetical protein SAMN04490356_0884 [Streptomyces melanosporofaciens]